MLPQAVLKRNQRYLDSQRYRRPLQTENLRHRPELLLRAPGFPPNWKKTSISMPLPLLFRSRSPRYRKLRNLRVTSKSFDSALLPQVQTPLG